jgi:hypothetical protein
MDTTDNLRSLRTKKVRVRSLVAIKGNAALTDHLNIVSEAMNLTTIGYIVTYW